MNDPQTTILLTEEDRKLLREKYFLIWIIYKWFLIGLTAVFGCLELWAGWMALSDKSVEKIFFSFTCLLAGTIAFSWWTTSVYKKKNVALLERDLKENRKTQKIGLIIAFKSNRYAQKLIFQAPDQAENEEFLLNPRIHRVYGNDLIHGREVELEYTPHARFLLSVRLLAPLTLEEAKQHHRANQTLIIAMFALPGVVLLGLRWLVDTEMWLPFVIIYAICLVIQGGVFWYYKPKS